MAAAADPALQALQKEVGVLKELQADMQRNLQVRNQLQAQQGENEAVFEELNRLDEDANIYKLIGPALIKQDLVEAKSNVSKRLEFIKTELTKSDDKIKSLQNRIREKQQQIQGMQQPSGSR